MRVHAKLFGEELARKVGFVLGFDGVNFDARGRPNLVIAYHSSVLWTRPGYRFSDSAILEPPGVKRERSREQARRTKDFAVEVTHSRTGWRNCRQPSFQARRYEHPDSMCSKSQPGGVLLNIVAHSRSSSGLRLTTSGSTFVPRAINRRPSGVLRAASIVRFWAFTSSSSFLKSCDSVLRFLSRSASLCFVSSSSILVSLSC